MNDLLWGSLLTTVILTPGACGRWALSCSRCHRFRFIRFIRFIRFWVHFGSKMLCIPSKTARTPPRRRHFSLPGPSQAQSRPKALTRDAKGRPRHPKVSQRESNGMQKWANGRDGSTPTAQSGKSKHKKEEKNNKTRYIPKLPINRPSGRCYSSYIFVY